MYTGKIPVEVDEEVAAALVRVSRVMLQISDPSIAIRNALPVSLVFPLQTVAVYILEYGTSTYRLLESAKTDLDVDIPSTLSHGSAEDPGPFTLCVNLSTEDPPIAILAVMCADGHCSAVTDYLDCLASLIGSFVRQQILIQTLNALRPVDPHEPYEEVLKHLIETAHEASRMFCVVFRRFHRPSRSFRTEVESGLKLALRDYDNTSLYDPEPQFLEDMLAGRPHARANAFSLPGYSEYRGLRDVKSFVIYPVLNDGKLYGSLHFCSLSPHKFPALEVDLIRRIADHVAQAIRTHLLMAELREEKLLEIEAHSALTMLELATLARHQVLDHIVLLQEAMGNLMTQISKEPAKYAVLNQSGRPFQSLVERLLKNAEDALTDLDKMKAFTQWRGSAKQQVGVRKELELARSVLLDPLNRAGIELRIGGPEVLLRIAPDLVRYAFIALILNSIEAFKTSVKDKRSKRIVMKVCEPNERQRSLEIDYFDNAGGVDLYRLRGADRELLSEPSAIFLQGVTSKSRGSGHGLHIVRRILAEHGGSIDLVPVNDGIGFKIHIRKE